MLGCGGTSGTGAVSDHCRLIMQKLMAESQQLGTVVGWEQVLDTAGAWLPLLAWAGYS